ncbi:MAG: polysaccharide biosynthesis tyrosine autokinase [Verrucomicrobiota bacterium]|jgi:capsular exopolysaccharide synthesis family protein
MNEEPSQITHDRPAWTGRFFARLQRYRNLLFQRWWVLIICAGLATGGEAVYLWLSPPRYVSVGQMIVGIKLNIQQGALYTEELGNFLGTQAALMQGTEVVNRARDRVASQNPSLTPQSISMNVSVLPKTTIFVLRATGQNPKYTQAFLQACMEEYINLKKQMVEHTSSTTIAGLTEQMLQLEPALQKCDDEMQSFLSTNDAALLQEASGVENYLALLYQQLADARSEYALLQSMTLDQNLLLEQSETPVMAGASPAANQGTAGGLLVNAGLAGRSGLFAPNAIGMAYLTIKQQILLLQAEQNRFGEYLKPAHPEMVALAQEIDQYQQMLGIYRDQSVEQLDAKKSALTLQLQNLEAQTKQWGQQNLELSRKSAQYQRLKAKADRIQSLYNSLLATMETLDVNKDISPETVTMYQEATVAIPEDVLAKGLTIAGALGLVLGVVVLMFLERVDDRMSSFTELQELFDEDVLVQIPREKKEIRGGILPFVQPDDHRHPFVESYRNLRSSLLYMAEMGTRPHTLLVTSAVPNDGKSVTAANLAITLAMGGARVLLVDADLRKGTLHSRFDLPSGTGLSEALAQKTDWRPAVKDTTVPNLRLLPRGATTQNSSELFIGPVMEKFLQEANKEYDYVLIDTVPVMAADDVTSLAPRVDAVIFVIRAEFTSARVARAALDMLYQRKSRVLGLVFNSVRATSSDYYYYYRYQDYYKR